MIVFVLCSKSAELEQLEQPVDESDMEVDVNKESAEHEKADNIQVM